MTTENISLVVTTQQRPPEQQQQQQQQLYSAQKPRPLGRVRVQGQKAAAAGGQRKKSEDFSVQGEAFTAAERQGSLPPINSPQQQQQQPHQRQPSIQPAGSPPPSDAGRLARLQQREQELLKRLQEASAREKLLKEQLDRLEKLVATAERLLEEERLARQANATELAQASTGSDRYRQLYEDECRAHEATRRRAEQLAEQHQAEAARLAAQADALKAQLEQLAEQHRARLEQLQREHQEALADRDKRIDNLKRQVAGALGTNSHERQSQIDQMNREMQKMADEVEALRRKRAAASGGGGGGDKCQQCPQKDAALRDQGEQIRQLHAICQRFRGQLGEQEQVLVMLLDRGAAAVAAKPGKR